MCLSCNLKKDSILYFEQYLAVNNKNYEIKTWAENHENAQQKGLHEKFQHNTFAFNMWDDKICFGYVYSRHRLRFLWEFDCCYCLHNLKLFVCLVHVLVVKQFLTSIQQPWIIYYINLICNAKKSLFLIILNPNVLSHWCWFKVKIRIDGWFVRKTFNRAILLKKNHIFLLLLQQNLVTYF